MKIITISGASGSGKTTLAEHLLSLDPKYQMIPSVTIREPRERDLPGEFLYISHDEFEHWEHEDKFLWVTPPIHRTRYGTLRESVGKALTSSGVWIMVMTIEHLSRLRFYAARDARNILGIYISSPGEAVLKIRMSTRGDKQEDIERRLKECRGWDALAEKIDEQPPIVFIQNEGTLDEFLAKGRQQCHF